MKKAPEAFRTISEVSDILDTPAHVLRFWESKFYQIRPVKRAGGRRYYRPDDLALLAGIRLLLQDQGMTIRGVQKILQEQGVRHVASLAPDPSVEESFNGSIEEGSHDTSDSGSMDMPAESPANTDTDTDTAADTAPPPRMPEARPAAPLPVPDSAEVAPERQPEAAPYTAAARPADIPAAPPESAPETEDSSFGADRGPAATGPVTDAPPEAESGSAVTPPSFRPEPSSADLPPPSATPRATPRAPVSPAPDLSDHALNLGVNAGTERLARVLRGLPRDALLSEHDKAAMLARRIDALLDRMSDASGAGRW